MPWIANFLFFQRMLKNLGEVQRLGRYLGGKCQEAKQAPFFTHSTNPHHPLKFIV
jgi:hypothetical protein